MTVPQFDEELTGQPVMRVGGLCEPAFQRDGFVLSYAGSRDAEGVVIREREKGFDGSFPDLSFLLGAHMDARYDSRWIANKKKPIKRREQQGSKEAELDGASA